VFRHTVVFRFSPESTAEQVEALTAGLSTLPAQIPEIRSYQIGPNVGDAVENWHYAVVADFDDVAGWRVYANHPRHVEVIRECVHPILADRAAVQYEV
jgi:hypothetical protein